MNQPSRWGRKPSPSGTIRNEPVRREEVLITPDWQIMTMPENTYRYTETFEEIGSTGHGWWITRADGVEELWRPLLDELCAEREEQILKRKAHWDEFVKLVSSRGHPLTSPDYKPPVEPKTQFKSYGSSGIIEYQCHNCGSIFVSCDLSYSLAHQGEPLCSNACVRAHKSSVKKRWYHNHPDKAELIEKANAARARRSAERRQGKVCECCGGPIDAERSTKRYCSDKCRVAAHRRRATP